MEHCETIDTSMELTALINGWVSVLTFLSIDKYRFLILVFLHNFDVQA